MKSKYPKNVRLTPHIIPLIYDLQIRPDLEGFTFQGIETITIFLKKPTKNITLHSKEIEVSTGDIIAKKEKIVANKITYNEEADTVTFSFPKNIPQGKVKLTLVFKGILNDKMRGFYRSRYIVDGKDFHMATTQFEATDARRAFPCFDEPAHKAIFHVSLVIPKGHSAISNTLPISTKEHEAGYEIVRFAPTPKMSTYLLAFIVGQFEYVEKKSKSGVLVRVYTTPGKKHQAGFALEVTIKVLDFYEKYFDIKYPLNTLDMVAIPDFIHGAMENWGAVTYRESALLVDEKHSSAVNKQWVALVIAHELAHQWFGNLVTMEWWTHLWLNEGFASYIEYLAVDKLFPEWDIWTQFATNDLGVALRLDALESTHPIEATVYHPNEISEIFDEVSYSKGASIIRMLAGYLGETNFRDGLRHYLKKHSYKNTETLHLWESFEKIAKKPVKTMMHNWTSKPGYPLLRASIYKDELRVSQERFFANPISKQKSKDKTIWQVPILFTNENYTKINLGETGFYRTAYSKELLEKLKEPVQNKSLSPRDRLGIIRDLFALAESGDIPTTDALEFLSAYKNEDNYTVWVELATGLGRLEQLLSKSSQKEKLNKVIADLFSPLVTKLGWEHIPNESHGDNLLRRLAIRIAGQAGNKEIIKEAQKRFANIENTHMDPDIRTAVYTIVAAYGGMKEYDLFVSMYKKELLHEEKNRIGVALGDFRNLNILKLVCEFSLSEHVRYQDSSGILSSVAANPIGRDIWWNFVQKNWKELVMRYSEGGSILARIIKAISASAEEKHLTSFRKFFQTHDAPGAKRAIEQVVERLEGNIAWLKRDKKSIEKFLKQY